MSSHNSETKNISDDTIDSLHHGIAGSLRHGTTGSLRRGTEGSLRHGTNPLDAEKTSFITWYNKRHDLFFILRFLATVVLLIWPWIFLGVAWQKGGLPMGHFMVAEKHPKDTSYFVTFITGIITYLIGALFQKAVTSLAQKCLVHKDVAILRISFFITLRSHGFSLSFFRRSIPLFFVLSFYFVIFLSVNPGIVALLTPTHFTKTVPLNGFELNFASNDANCTNWLDSLIIPNTCDWKVSSTIII